MHGTIAALGADPAPTGPAAVEIDVNGTVVICDRAGVLWLPASGALVVSDLHLEKGAAHARRGMLLPPYDTAATLARLGEAITRYDPRLVISLGDSFHDRIGSQHLPEPYRQALQALQRGRDWAWIEGNHDPEKPVGLEGAWCSELHLETLVFRHEPRPGAADGEIAGHLHPAARVVRRGKAVRRPCFASDGKRLLMPAFGSTTGGLELRHPALRGLFDRNELIAHLLGRDRIYSVAFNRMNG
ncbi:MAG: ligase-associated DNA damage response endonuclease PdeM [Hoeflea sp.]|uniref:ligase-associated DNA damage response endonuclease PdeM n=1 Tax=Hoeflea sp. TaxID=1940281 RepID=UPI001DC4BE0D|nr:ligase-associated DNA damage response endonuclease PdeM [Hoeflea sp.]MBU4531207.1 ligase-associated DNA damage response endonuclease PdeM [Alphaproteobacteria bacterium]MBU4545731.1 ligase-associated DNA damage response endonuclease PdeM [Alphaproteobacteria bacterium]MBU4550700.1 ligase-associated DNA damage response endonuclease PdeM [Alphaproteobacteria bacterium]MBV1724484.1 ligase-associated DNA damage response endonuclease PdeM [Hoeflea sp.]MBV1760504.1 ligase-associated DNA damage re